MGPNQTYKLLHSKGNHKKLKLKLKNKKATYGMGENICKWCNWQGLNLQNIQTTHTTQQQKNQTTQSKNEQKTLIDISPKKTYRWPVDTWKGAQYH